MRVRLINGRRTLESLLLSGVGTCKRTVGGSCLFRAEGDIRQNSPTVQIEASAFRHPSGKGQAKTVRIEPVRQRN